MTTLAWGGVAYKAGYQSAGEWENLLAAVKWGTDYFIKCHTSDTEFYGQVSHVPINHVSIKLYNILSTLLKVTNDIYPSNVITGW